MFVTVNTRELRYLGKEVNSVRPPSCIPLYVSFTHQTGYIVRGAQEDLVKNRGSLVVMLWGEKVH